MKPASRPLPPPVKPPERPSGAKARTTVAVVIATAPPARLPCEEGTLSDRVAAQLATLPVRRLRLVTRSADGPGPASRSGGVAVEVVTSDGLPDDLRAVAAAARAGGGPLAVVPGDLVAHTEAFALLLADPARGTGALVSPGQGPLAAPAVRTERGRVVAAGNSFHTVSGPDGVFHGVLHVGEADLASLAEVADELANLARDHRLGDVGEGELPELLLAGLVRVGVPVRAVPVGRLHCGRVASRSAAQAAIAGLAEVDEHHARLRAAVKSEDGFVATFLVSSWSGHLVRLAARLGLTPNAVTGLSVGLAGLAAVAFSAGERRAQVAGAALLFLSFVLDCVDGQLARYTRTFSPLGAWLDATFDRVKEYVAYAGLAIGYAADVGGGVLGPGGVWGLAVTAMLVQAIRHMIDFSYAGARADAEGLDPIWQRPGYGASLGLPSGARPPDPPAAPGGGRGRLVVRLSARLDRNTAARWLKKIVVLPIGERMALIAVTAALFNARVTFLALLAWGGLAALYTLTGRIARSL
ncbi:CDP-alcohol phosphatidyltransferase family protein [Sphaerisporangium fuscum]|uniref:CDP-alcohol phosphatidyltransferase family protein n=1 Tax=Sphaerisporangium fuscum TaxID=2835868 RepID=UPI001BDD7C98|nr:CDP-alcohol phosphatidyltransferase family protein [Sphaerisporangium fuscum]